MENENEQPLIISSRTIQEESQNTINKTNDALPIDGATEFFKQFCFESKKLWYLAGPAVFTSVCRYSLGAVTQLFAGHVSTLALAAVSVENSVIAGFSFGVMLGMGSALETLCGQAFGAGQIDMLGVYLQRSWVILLTTGALLSSVYVFAGKLLRLIGQTEEISEAAGRFALWMIPQLFAYAMNFPIAKFLQAQSKIMVMAVIAAVALVLHTFFSWLLMLKLGWGLVGAAVVLNFSWWFIVVAQMVYVFSGSCGGAWSGFSWLAFQNIWGFVRLSLASAVMLCLEVWYFMALILFAGYLKNAKVSVDALSICMNILGWTIMVAFGFNAAISVRVSNELGAAHPRRAKISMVVAVVTSFIFGLVLSLILILTRNQYPSLFSTDNDVKALVRQLTPVLATCIIINDIQPVLSGVAIGAGWQAVVAYVNVACYYIFGIPLGLLLGYKLDMGVRGIWYGMLSGTVLQTCILFWMVYKTNWSKEKSLMEDNRNPLLHSLGGGHGSRPTSASFTSSFIADVDDIQPINDVPSFFKEFTIETKKLWYIAGPAIFTSVCQYSLGAITQIFSGQLGTLELAAVSVQNFVISGFTFGVLLGMGSALETLCGQAFGAGQLNMLGIYMQRSWIVLFVTGLILSLFYIFAEPILLLIGQTPEISKATGLYCLYVLPEIFAYALNFPITKFLQSQSKILVMSAIAAIALVLHTFFSWLFMLKLGWGLVGAAVVMNTSWWFIVVAQFIYILSGTCGEAWSGFSWKAFHNLWGFVKLSFASAVMLCLELWYFMVLIVFAGYLKNAQVSVDAMSICMNILDWTIMVSVGVNAAISVRVSNELGAAHPRTAKFSVVVAVITSFICGLLLALLLMVSRNQYPTIFSIDTEVQNVVKDLTPVLAFSIVINNIQPTLSGVAIGAGWQAAVAYVNIACYYVFGIPLGLILGYKLNMGITGIWYGMLAGTVLQTAVIFWIVYRTNWNKEASLAGDRIKKWGG